MKRLMLLIPLTLAVAAAQPPCSISTIRGTYAVSEFGTLTIIQQDAAPMTATGGIVGVLSVGYDGTISGVAAVSGFGPVTDYDASGAVQVNADCTGTISLKIRPKGTTEWTGSEVDRFVFDQDGKTLVVIVVDLGPGVYPAVQGTWKRISPLPNAANW